MSARFALLQQSLEVPEVARLERAFRAVKCLTASDARTLANDAFGILVKNLSAEDAQALRGALAVEGVATAAVLERDLPKLPPVKFVRQLEFTPEALVIFDPINRRLPVAWAHVMLLAAGNVRHFEFREKVTRRPSTIFDADLNTARIPGDMVAVETRRREEWVDHLILELVLTRATMRFQIQAEKFRFHALGDGERPAADEAGNFAWLVAELQRRAAGALVNRGAYLLRDQPGPVFVYPSKNAFYEEITWMLWRASQAPPPSGAGG